MGSDFKVNDIVQKYKEKVLTFWQQLDKKQKIKLFAVTIFLVASLALFTTLATRTKYEIALSDLSPKDSGMVVEKLEEMKIPYQLSAGGSIISVPEAEVDKVFITIAKDETISSGNIYSKFWEKSSFGMTDSEFQFVKKGAIEEELKQLIVRGIEGISNAHVMITLPEDKVFYSDEKQFATASVVINLDPNANLTPIQIKSIYNLISKSIPNLPVENITLADQYGDPLEYIAQDQYSNGIGSYNQQREIEKEFQQDIKKDIENMLANIMGRERGSVTAFAKMNFDQKKTVSNLFEPVVDGKGIARSIEQIQESFTGEGAAQGGVTGTGSTQIASYPSGSSENGSYEHIEDRINYEVNEITKEVISSPFRLEDLSITVVIDLEEDNDPNSTTGKTKQAVQDLITPIITAALSQQDADGTLLTVDVTSKIAVIAHEFEEKISVFDNQQMNMNPLLLYGAIGLSVLAIGGFGFNILRRRKQKELAEIEQAPKEKVPEFDFTPTLTEEAALQPEINKMSRQKSDEFVKLLRTWLSDE